MIRARKYSNMDVLKTGTNASHLRNISVVVVIGLVLLLAMLGQQVISIIGSVCSATTSGGGATTVVQKALLVLQHVKQTSPGQYDGGISELNTIWDGTGKTNWSDIQCVDLITGAFGLAGLPVPARGDAIDYWGNYVSGQHPGWTTIPLGTGAPLPGDVMVMSG